MTDFSSQLAVTSPSFIAAGLSFVFIFFLYTKIWKYATGADIGVPQIDELSAQIKTGAKSFLVTEYTYLTVFVGGLAGALFFLFYVTSPEDPGKTAFSVAIAFIFGASLSASAGWWGMMVAT